MKKIYLLLFVIALTLSCSTDDENSNPDISINPPAWLHGTWKAEDAGGTSITGFRFTTDDIILLGLYDMSYRDNTSSIVKSGGEATVEEDISQESYRITIDYSVGASVNYLFSRVDENTINWNTTTYGALELQKQ
ncbi:hypothetical protein [Salinimicrobium sp. HB62]|uniref:hypothetical protein n=1 Tax=Salinimicrobium sp. HB62 TaxID=3077781 RepID=UPI002D77B0E8|nr:hypothetical protein [Salinimicrobium sp. HB62]